MDKLYTYKEMEDLWQESRGETNPRTFQELVRLGKRIDDAGAKRHRLRTVFSALAVAASVAVAALVTFSLTRSKYTVSPLEATRSLVAEFGQTTSITLEDGTKVFLNAGSSLLYPDSFHEGSRIVYLTGEANFSVAKDPSRPFIVKTSHMDVQALGTTFCVHAYAGERTVRATLKEGKVKVDIPMAGGESYLLDPDMQLVYTPSEKTVSLSRVDAAKVLEWQQGYLSFMGASFPEIASVLERRFNVSISYNSEDMHRNALNVRFMPDESLEDALGVLTLLLPGSRYRMEGDRVFFQF